MPSQDPEVRDALRAQAAELPARPGVYLFRGEDDEILYVGKAKSLRSRVRSYFARDPGRSLKVRELVRRARRVESIVSDSEAEALLLEWNLIREHEPRFNIQLRDDKSYPYIKVTVGEPFPRVFVTRRLERDGSRYFGPFTDVGPMRSALRMIKKIYHVRSCRYDMPREMPERPCLDYHIGRCKAPCAGHQSREAYRAMIDEILEVLSGHTGKVKDTVRERMEAASGELDFERAAELRDVLGGLGTLERRRTAVDYRGGDRDVLGVAREGGLAAGVLLRVREGRLLGREIHFVRNVASEELPPVVEALVEGFYLRREDLPPLLLVPAEFGDRGLVREYLSLRRDGPFEIRVPRRGTGRRLLELASRNAGHVLEREGPGRPRAQAGDGDGPGRDGGVAPEAARRLAEALGLPAPPRALVCFDISTLQGADSVGSAVWLEDGRPRKSEYRKFRIRESGGDAPDDYAMMQEVVGRYFQRRVREGDDLPDLVVIDGGVGQLGAARQAMEAAGVSDLPVVALAKREEEVFRPDEREPLRLGRRDPALHWLQRVRDEAHRFALGYNRTLRRRRTLRSRLSEVPGVGPAREQELLRRFGSLAAVREASLEELAGTRGIGERTARRIREELGREEAPEGPAARPEGTPS
ncbi:MAG TPA: excinuclease ABC subunit UvrC [Gemmatimonadota bacterium]|nr:excinuclease ABC subunit UvrC [Gemmatimonadota bacterium]